MSVRLVVACAIASLAACKSTATPVADPSEVPVADVRPTTSAPKEPPAPSPAPPASSEPSATAEPTALGPHPGMAARPVARGPGIEQLGTACEATGTGCGRGNKLAVVRQSFWSSVPGQGTKLPCTAQPMTKGPPVMNAISGCVADGLLVLQSRCVMCRVDSRELMVGRITDMLPAQLKEAQAFAQLERESTLTTENAWSAAIAKAVSASK